MVEGIFEFVPPSVLEEPKFPLVQIQKSSLVKPQHGIFIDLNDL